MGDDSTYEVAIIGGGPAGSTAACALAQRGRRVVVLERQEFPRFHIGESLLPASNRVFQALGLEERMKGEGFVQKRGATFTTEDGGLSSHIDFAQCSTVPSPRTYQVRRDRFDQLLFEHAGAAGAELRSKCHVRNVSFEADAAHLTITDASGVESTLRAKVVIDASGQAGFLSKRLHLRVLDADLESVALHAHFEGITRPAGERAGDIRVISLFDMGWIWLIPLSDTVTSVGIVTSRQHLVHRGDESRQELLERLLRKAPAVDSQMKNVRRLSPARFEVDFSYAPRAYAGDRWLLAGDAGSFLDPVFSTGVLLALESGLEAAEEIHRALTVENASAAAFAGFERRQRRRFKYFRRFVRGFYNPFFRDLFFHPTNRLGLLDAIISALAGQWHPSLKTRLKIGFFFTLVAIQKRFPLVPRLHSSSG